MLRTILASGLILSIVVGPASAGFVAGNLVVVRVGDGSRPFEKGAAAPVFLDEFDRITGSVVGSVALPTESVGGQRRLTLSISATSEGQLSTSSDGRYLILAGYDAPLLMAKVPNSGSDAVPRVVARIGGSGRVDTSAFLVDGYSKNNVRAASSVDGRRFYLAGAGGGGGSRVVEAGGDGISKSLATSPENTRGLAVQGGQLYASTASGELRGIVAVGHGLPIEEGQASILVAPSPPDQTTPVATGPESETPSVEAARPDPKPTGFVFLGGKLYVADLESGLLIYDADDTGPEGLPRFKLATRHSLPGLACLTGRMADGRPELYGTDGWRPLQFHVDGSTVTTREIALAGPDRAFRGVAFAPTVVDEFAFPLPAVVLAASVAGLAGLALPGALVLVLRRKTRRKIHYDGTDILVDGGPIHP